MSKKINSAPNLGNKKVWKVIFQTIITIFTALGTVFGLESCGFMGL